MEHFYQTLGENWFTYPGLYQHIVEQAANNSHFVEVGVWKGMSASYMAVEIINSGKNIKFDCIDTWEFPPNQNDIPESMYDGLYETFLKNIEPVKHIINPIKGTSWESASLYKDKSLDFVFIDAAHDYESVKKDITAWLPKIKDSGIIAGHDYAWCKDVENAVNEIFAGEQILLIEGCWMFKRA